MGIKGDSETVLLLFQMPPEKERGREAQSPTRTSSSLNSRAKDSSSIGAGAGVRTCKHPGRPSDELGEKKRETLSQSHLQSRGPPPYLL
mmetsp:Transcript_46435/g.91640  ORF Transcript_46435/g.91640 Transcript_46435/m.91640 type:complete len:89 (+) Transcript_46435:290-556(+)